jgi:hypothetical protein
MKGMEVAVRRVPAWNGARTAQNGRYDNLSRLAFRTDSTRLFGVGFDFSAAFRKRRRRAEKSIPTPIPLRGRRFAKTQRPASCP